MDKTEQEVNNFFRDFKMSIGLNKAEVLDLWSIETDKQ